LNALIAHGADQNPSLAETRGTGMSVGRRRASDHPPPAQEGGSGGRSQTLRRRRRLVDHSPNTYNTVALRCSLSSGALARRRLTSLWSDACAHQKWLGHRLNWKRGFIQRRRGTKAKARPPLVLPPNFNSPRDPPIARQKSIHFQALSSRRTQYVVRDLEIG
jgi:hypothetical protein